MRSLKSLLSPLIVFAGLSWLAGPALAAPSAPSVGGATSVELSPVFLSALTSLKVTPAAVAPARLENLWSGVVAKFPITTGQIDFGTAKAEVDHSGGLSLTAGSTVVELTSFIIDLTGASPVLTGLVTANGSLVGRLPLFDLNLSKSAVSHTPCRVKVTNVAVTLTDKAAAALNGVFNITALAKGVPIGTATVRAFLGGEENED